MVKWNNEYQVYVSDDGHIFNRSMHEYFIENAHGYLRIRISRNSIIRRIFIHRLVYLTFIGTIPAGMQIDHIDKDRTNNNVSNLRCVTPKENCKNRDYPPRYVKSWSEFGRLFEKHFGFCKSQDKVLYNRERKYWKNHGKCSWE